MRVLAGLGSPPDRHLIAPGCPIQARTSAVASHHRQRGDGARYVRRTPGMAVDATARMQATSTRCAAPTNSGIPTSITSKMTIGGADVPPSSARRVELNRPSRSPLILRLRPGTTSSRADALGPGRSNAIASFAPGQLRCRSNAGSTSMSLPPRRPRRLTVSHADRVLRPGTRRSSARATHVRSHSCPLRHCPGPYEDPCYGDRR